MPSIEDLEFKIAKLEMCDDDILVVKYSVGTTWEHIRRVEAFFRKIYPNLNVILLPSNLELSVISKEEANKLRPRKPPERIIPADLP